MKADIQKKNILPILKKIKKTIGLQKGQVIMRTTWASQTETLSFPWWMVLLEGVAAVIIGFFLLLAPWMATLVLVQFFGFYWLFSGILSLVSIFGDRSLWRWKLCTGILGIIAGLIVIRHPLWSALLLPTTLMILLGFLGLILGVVKFVQAFQGAGFGAALLGMVNIIFGIILLVSPLMAVLVLPIVAGIFAIVGGSIVIAMAFRLHHAFTSFAESTPNY
jgi:uncharacterized membrane protein HdeD (DUF308 family)